jgi:hypothetical protein
MKSKINLLFGLGLAITLFGLSSCHTEDPGPLQEDEKQFSIVDFDRLEMGSAFIIDVEQGNFFSVEARGDRRNIDDLKVYKDGNTLVIRYDDNHNRKHDTFITITMPSLRAANFSGASNSRVSGFLDQDELDFYLSGASLSQLDIDADEINIVISGASNLTLTGSGAQLNSEISGASLLNSFNYTVGEVKVSASGASKAHVYADDELDAIASGASIIYYKGTPNVQSSVSGASSVVKF